MSYDSESNEEDKSNQIGLNFPEQNSVDLDSETFFIQESLVHHHIATYQIPPQWDPRDFENIDLEGICVDEASSYFEYSNKSSVSNSQSQEENAYEGQILGAVDLTPTAMVPEKKRRRLGPDSLVLGQFKRKRQGERPKKEYVRLRVLRGHKRANREIIQGQIPKKGLHAFVSRNGMCLDIWNVLRAICLRNISTISESCKTENGPKTDGRAKRANVSSSDANSCNNKFCIFYFSIEGILESYFWYIELIFAEANPSLLCNRFKMLCCAPDGKHSELCVKKWQSLHYYLNKYMIRDLKEVTPWFPPEYWQEDTIIEDLIKKESERNRPKAENEEILNDYTR
ncbi:unnamed protein product [Blepharisma stoltei]|uniref:Uncharacterized protein n=1 Tax=Blepharisma stoltei TaxID=1481888 RepID=A0AAU9ITH1_9CILI|nr:unnamed protein product [Blepharisma stoltei]